MSTPSAPADADHCWSIGDLRHFLHRRLRYQVPRSTLARWKAFLGVQPLKISQRCWLYSDSDRDWLITLGLWLQAGRTFEEFEHRYGNGTTQRGNTHYGQSI